MRDLLLLPLQQLVYRQLMYAVLIQSLLSAAAGTRLRWRKAPRAGSFSAAPKRPVPFVGPKREPAALDAARPFNEGAA